MIYSVADAKKAVRNLRKAVKSGEVSATLTHTQALGVLANMLGYPTWNALHAHLQEVEEAAEPALPSLEIFDEIPQGETGQLVTLEGETVVGTFESLVGTAGLVSASRLPDGSLDVDFEGYTEIDWDSQQTQKAKNGELLFVTEDGTIVPASKVKVVAEA